MKKKYSPDKLSIKSTHFIRTYVTFLSILCCISWTDCKGNDEAAAIINNKDITTNEDSLAYTKCIDPEQTLRKDSTAISDLSDNDLYNIYVKNLDVHWKPVNTVGVDSYNPQTMQGITKNRSSVILSYKIPHSKSDIYNLVTNYNARPDVDEDQSNAFQSALDNISGYDDNGKKGGILIIPKGVYNLKNVCFRSNVMILCQPGVIFKPYISDGYTDKITIFLLGDRKSEKIENTGLRGILGSRVKFILPEWGKGITSININKVEHYIFSDINFYDQKTIYCCFGFGPGNPKDHTDFPRPTDGYIGYASSYNCNFGYGLMQIQSARMLHVEHIYSQGGVCYRLETGWNLMNKYSTQGEGGVFDITGYDINAEDGASAVLMSPHSQQCEGTVCIEKVHARSCEFSIQVGNGFVAKEKVGNSKTKQYIRGYDEDGNNNVTLTPGKFNSQSFIRNIDVTFGTNAQCRYSPEIVKYMPEEYMKGIKVYSHGESHPEYLEGVASIAPVSIKSEEPRADKAEYVYSIDWSKTKITIHNFKYNNGNTIETMNPILLH